MRPRPLRATNRWLQPSVLRSVLGGMSVSSSCCVNFARSTQCSQNRQIEPVIWPRLDYRG